MLFFDLLQVSVKIGNKDGAGFLAILISLIKNKKIKNNFNLFIPVIFLKISNLFFLSELNLKLFFSFLKIGAILYGSGYVLFAFLDSEFVTSGILTRQQLVDAIAIGQFTPGPVFSSVTFIGYQINNLSGALISTFAIFLPSFIFVALINPFVKKLRNSKIFSAFLDAVNVASVAIIISICFQIGKEVIIDWRSCVIGIISIIFMFYFKKVNNVFVVFGGAILGYILTFM